MTLRAKAHTTKTYAALLATVCLTSAALPRWGETAFATEPSPATRPAANVTPSEDAHRPRAVAPIPFERQTLDNGLRVIYAPMDHAPVAHVRVIYHVGSRDERPDRQGFAHLFEHMMFRGSEHVASEQHMRLIRNVGGESNAFTSFDQTAYVNTVPSNQVELAVWLEADRMASFKVTDEVYETERNVVAEEWRLRNANPPYGNFFADFAALTFREHHYRWTPIGDMDHLATAEPRELQAFFNTYYVPNNATLVIAGSFDVETTRADVERYFGWIPPGPPISRLTPPEPEQTEPRKRVVARPNVPLVRVMTGWKTTDYAHDDQVPLSLLASVVGEGASSHLYRALVGSTTPIASAAAAWSYPLQDVGLFALSASGLPDGPASEAFVNDLEAAMLAELRKVSDYGVTTEELDKAKQQARVQILTSRQTAEQIAGQLGEEEVFAGDAGRVNRWLDQIDRTTPQDLTRVAERYLTPERRCTLAYVPGGVAETAANVDEGMSHVEGAANPAEPSPDLPAAVPEAPTTRRVQVFPDEYPRTAPISDATLRATFAKGDEVRIPVESDAATRIDRGLRVILLPDSRLPLVSWTLVTRAGSHAEPSDRAGLGDLTAALVTRGAGGVPYERLSEELASRGLTLSASDQGDHTTLSGFGPREHLPFLIATARDVLTSPNLDPDEFERLRQQTVGGLRQQLTSPAAVATRDLRVALYGDDHPLGRQPTPRSVTNVSLDDVRAWHARIYRPDDAFLVIAGDVSPEEVLSVVAPLVGDWRPASVPTAEYPPVEGSPGTRVEVIDNPDGRQAVVRMAAPAFTLASDEKFAGAVAGRILSGGIDSRLNQVLRAERGLTYGSGAFFRPTRQTGTFEVTFDTKPESVRDAIEATFGVLRTMADEPVTPQELTDTRRQVAGMMLLETETVGQQAQRRVDVELNDYPLDYFDVYPERIAAVTAEDVQAVMRRYVRPEAFTLVVVSPAGATTEQVERFGVLTVRPMPLHRDGVSAASPAEASGD